MKALNRAIYTLLTADTTLMALAKGGVHEGIVPPNTPVPYVLIQKDSGVHEWTIGSPLSRDYAIAVYGVTDDGHGSPSSYAQRMQTGDAIAERIELLLNDADLTVPGYDVLICRQDTEIDRTRRTKGRTLRERGGVYQIELANNSRVEPLLEQVGSALVSRATGEEVTVRGATVSVVNCIGNTMYKTVQTLLGGNFLTIRVTWNDYEATPPTGGDPSQGTYTTRNYDATFDAKLLEMMEWCEANGVYFMLRTGHTGADGVAALGGSSGWPDWLYADSSWTLPQVAPLPADRAGYGGAYASGGQGRNNVDSAFWTPYDGDSRLANDPLLHSTDGKVWHGDHERVYQYLHPLLERLVTLSQRYQYCIGYNFFNEPDPGELRKSFNMGNQIDAVERMIDTQAIYYDALRVVEPTRFFTTHGLGGHTYTQTPDFSRYWGATGAACPASHHFSYECHLYMSGQAGLTAPEYDQDDALFNQTSLAASPGTPQVVTLTGFDTNGDQFKLRYNGSNSAQFTRGTNATAAAIQASLRTLTGDAALTVTGTTDAGPFTITFVNETEPLPFTVKNQSGCTVTISDPGDAPGTPNNVNVYAPTPGQSYIEDTITIIKAKMDSWGIPITLGEFGIQEDIVDSAEYFTDIDDAVRAQGGGVYPSAFFLGTGGKGLVNDLGGDTYELNTLGTRWAAQLAIPY